MTVAIVVYKGLIPVVGRILTLQTQGRFSSNASAFGMERKGVFFTNKNKRKYYTEIGIKKGVPLYSNLC